MVKEHLGNPHTKKHNNSDLVVMITMITIQSYFFVIGGYQFSLVYSALGVSALAP